MTYKLIKASAHNTGLPNESVHMICTSSPYFGLRAYSGEQDINWPEVSYSPMIGLPPIVIKGCDPDCQHEWSALPTKTQPAQRDHDGPDGFRNTRGEEKSRSGMGLKLERGGYCIHCGGWRGGLGAEPAPEAFIGHLILVLREMHRVLRDDGTLFWNLGDSFSGSGGAHTLDHANPGISKSATRDGTKYKSDGGRGPDKTGFGIPNKNMLLIPERFVLAAQADGWIVRSDLPWIKRNGLPGSQDDRPTTMTEHVIMLSKSPDYFYDHVAIKQSVAESSKERLSQDIANQTGSARANGGAKTNGNIKAAGDIVAGRTFRNTDLFFRSWQGLLTNEEGDPLALIINPKGYKGAHFATYPLKFPSILIKAGTSAYGVCAKCGSPWERIVEEVKPETREIKNREGSPVNGHGKLSSERQDEPTQTITTGWQPTCVCGCNEVVPATVLDPFAGSGTTLKAAVQLKRNAIGVDICGEYLENLAVERVDDDDRAAAGLPKKLKGKDNDLMNMPLFAEVA